MNFNQLSWGAFCFYYRSGGDYRYGRMMKDTAFLSKLRRNPGDISPLEFEEKVILHHVNIENYDLLVGHNLARNILAKIIELHYDTSYLQDFTILDCDLSDENIVGKINRIYTGLYSVHGLWLTGVSKIAHLLNDELLPILNLNISNHFGLLEGDTSLLQWLRITQQNAREVVADFNNQGFQGLPSTYLSDKLGYSEMGYQKSLVKFLDEFFWLRFGDHLPLPPRWVPPWIKES